MEALVPYKNEIEAILVGLPLMMNGTRGQMAELAEKFAEALRTVSGLRVECVDERLTSAQADRALRDLDMNRKERSKAIDSVSATLLLQAYLDRKS
jgi:putative Holliday junction resolvase